MDTTETFKIPQIRYLFEIGNDVLWVRDPTYQIQIYVSKSYEYVWGRSVDSLYNNPQSFVDTVIPADRDKLTQSINKRIAPVYPGETFRVFFRIFRPNGEIRFIRDDSYAIFDDSNEHIGYAGIARDITDVYFFTDTNISFEFTISQRTNDVQLCIGDSITITNRELQCFYYVIRGKTASQISTLMYISIRTAEAYIKSLKSKLKCPAKSDLIEYAFNHNLHQFPLELIQSG